MKKVNIAIAVIALCFLVSSNKADWWSDVKNEAKKIGKKVEEKAKKAGQEIEKAGKKIKTEIEGGLKTADKEIRELFDDIKNTALEPAIRMFKSETDQIALLNLCFKPDQVKPCTIDPATMSFEDVLITIKKFLDSHPREVFTLMIEDYTKNYDQIKQVFKKTDLLKYVHIQDQNKPWPTLGKMIQGKKPLVVFIDRDAGPDYPWLNYTKNYVISTKYSFKTPQALGNDSAGLGDWQPSQKGNRLLLMQHFVTPGIAGSKKAAAKVNTAAVLKRRITHYKKIAGTDPNFISVDFVGTPNNDLFDVVRELNA